MSALHKKQDLTRWNRSGLSRIRYVDGNAVTYLEALRLAMRDAFTAADGTNQWAALDTAIPELPDETAGPSLDVGGKNHHGEGMAALILEIWQDCPPPLNGL